MSQIVELDLSDRSIGSYEDLRVFVNLASLDVSRNSLPSDFFSSIGVHKKLDTPTSTSPPQPTKRLTKIKKTGNDEIPTSNSTVPIGVYVKHSIFGIGKILKTSMVDGNEKAEIDFGEKGIKSLLLKFAKLEILK